MTKDLEKLVKTLKKENRNLQKNIEGLLTRQREQEQENAKQKARFNSILQEFQIRNKEMDFLTSQLELSFGQINETNGRLKKEIIEHQRAEKDLKISEDKYRTIFETAGTAIAITDENFRVSMANTEFKKIFANDGEELEGRSFKEFIIKNEKADFADSEAKALIRAEIPVTREIQVTDSLGEARNVISTVTGIPDSPMIVISIVDITERKKVEELIRKMAYHDSLTGLPNRKFFHQKFVHEIAEAKQAGAYLGMLFLDLDGFKNINDSFGHEAGDKVLQEVAVRLKSVLRDCDTVARMGGDEFTILLSKISKVDETIFIARRIFEVFKVPALIEGVMISVGTSIGISIFPLDGDSPEELIKKADDAMYLSKQTEKNNFQLYCDSTESNYRLTN